MAGTVGAVNGASTHNPYTPISSDFSKDEPVIFRGFDLAAAGLNSLLKGGVNQRLAVAQSQPTSVSSNAGEIGWAESTLAVLAAAVFIAAPIAVIGLNAALLIGNVFRNPQADNPWPMA